MKLVPQSAICIAHTPDAQSLIEQAGRTCYRSEGSAGEGTAGPLCKMLIARGHESVLEHASATFRIVTDRGIMAELTRHRLASYSVESTRYCDYAKGELSFVEPPRLFGMAREDWLHMVTGSELGYLELRRQGVPPEIARSVLPLSLATEMVMTANLREWRTILRQRLDKRAHPQMRELMGIVLGELRIVAPYCFHDFEEVDHGRVA